MKGSRITIKDIAKILGISPSTVSRALKDHPDISPATKQKVQALAKKHNYRPNPIALNLKHNRSNTIGVIIPEIVHYFFSSVISGIGDYAYSHNYNVYITQSSESYEREVNDTQSLVENRVDGILISVAKETQRFAHLEHVIQQGIPIVFFDRYVEHIAADKVVVDDYQGAYDVVQHLIDKGAKHIAYLGMHKETSIGKSRLTGYTNALKDNQLPIQNELIVECDSYDAAREITPRLLDQHPEIDGLFAVNDGTAIGAMDVVKSRGLQVPEQIRIAGFTNGQISRMCEPKLTTVDQNGYLMGQQAAKMLIDRLQGLIGDDYSPKTKVLDTNVVIRGSTDESVQ